MNGSCSGQGARRSICQVGLSILQIAHSEAMPRAGGSRALEDEKMLASSLRFYRVGAFGYRFKSAAISNEQIRQVVCPTSCLPHGWLRPNQSVTRPTPWPSFSDRFTTTCEGNIPNGSSQAASLPYAIFT